MLRHPGGEMTAMHARRRLTQLLLALLVSASLLPTATPVGAATLSPYVVTDIGTFGGSFSTPMDINDAGQVVGIAATTLPDPYVPDSEQTRAFLFEGGVLRNPQINTCGSLTIDNRSTIFYRNC